MHASAEPGLGITPSFDVIGHGSWKSPDERGTLRGEASRYAETHRGLRNRGDLPAIERRCKEEPGDPELVNTGDAMVDNSIFRGCIPALMTPCAAEGTPDFDLLVKYYFVI